jgi:hypothetical protein
VIPQDAQLTPWPKDILKEWDQLTPLEKKLFIRQADVYGAYLAYTDHEIGRMIQAVEDLGRLENTLIIYISGDNGCSAEGSVNGTPNEVIPFNGITLTAEEQMPWYDVWGDRPAGRQLGLRARRGWLCASCRAFALGDVVILDNLGSHKGKAVRKANCDVGARLVFLKKYSPDLNPIEQVFAKFKTLLRKAEARSYEAISDACGKILAQYPPAECAAYIKNAGYA